MHRKIIYMDPQVMERSVGRALERNPEMEETVSPSVSLQPSLAPQYSLPSKSVSPSKRTPTRLPTLPIEKRKPLRLQRMERPNGRPLTATNSIAGKSTASRQSTVDSFLVKSADSVELSMLRSIARLSRQTTRSFDESLREHEYEDLSDEELLEKPSVHQPDIGGKKVMGRNAISAHPNSRLIKQNEIEGTPQAVRRRAHSAQSTNDRHLIREMEDRLQGFRHEKTSSTQRSQKSTDFSSELTAGLIYDADFDCYYCPDDDTYYRLVPD
ncbi:unnamed protein product, partial [Mesorhabditis belari]|uniref:Uncharacterized protein n=1 Tax=Mesorhabditis belari TaxID=2138241 RepID=A0AAF3EYK4_9BILA